MNRWLKITMWIVSLIATYYFLIPKFKHKNIYSKDGVHLLTAITYPNTVYQRNETYFTPGFYKFSRIPNVYVKPKYSLENDWVIHVTFHKNGIFFLGDAEVRNISDTFSYLSHSITNYKESRFIDSLKESFKNAEDTSFVWSDFK